MTMTSNAPIIIKRKKITGGDGHHGGAWKVAYADFVTAMMAFFMLMWLLNATTEQQRKGIADYFSPTIPINRISGGGDGAFGGDNIFTDNTLAQSGTNPGATGDAVPGATAEEAAQVAALEQIEEQLLGRGGESMIADEALQHIVTKLTDEGLVIEIFDLDGAPLFAPGTAEPEPVTVELAAVFARVLALVDNDVALAGHVRARPVVVADSRVWPLSTSRATRFRELLEASGQAPERIVRVTGHADRAPAVRNAVSLRNNRLEVVVLRSDR
ncbi:putative chemotaxis MotB protein [Oceanicola granulosus HTCC2516]|uniref:Putative chemotaxis MotB protein n=1 Tax=Oceanicola granulosus (strain ATCC BAA-861 / DSM 15982 / KCTC 12143 / HTCC2516) TaxID=314256 RepID=Q2CJK0_OCEGH|nr:flagellar motor protein MotB [Oceanicola granulosus]EAR53139.1 putative chemotaxis MotB protein [Oceanicola granulosus HTCC2516]